MVQREAANAGSLEYCPVMVAKLGAVTTASVERTLMRCGAGFTSAETVSQKSNTKNLVQLKVVGMLPRNDTLFRAQVMLSYAGRDSWGPVAST